MASLACGQRSPSYWLGTEVLSWEYGSRMLTSHLCLLPRLSMSGALPSLTVCSSMAWTRETFTSFFDVEYIYGFIGWGVCKQSQWRHSVTEPFWCRIHLWFHWMGGLQAKSMTSQRYRAITRWGICVTMATLWQQQDGGYVLLWQRYSTSSTVQS